MLTLPIPIAGWRNGAEEELLTSLTGHKCTGELSATEGTIVENRYIPCERDSLRNTLINDVET
jgi:hypothetical protein